METVTTKSHDTAETGFACPPRTPNTFNLLKWKLHKYYSGCMWCWHRRKCSLWVATALSFGCCPICTWLWHWHTRVSQGWSRMDSLEAPPCIEDNWSLQALSRSIFTLQRPVRKMVKKEKTICFAFPAGIKLFTGNGAHWARFIGLGSFCSTPGTASNPSLLPIKSVSFPTGEKPQRLPARERNSLQELSAVALFSRTSETSDSCHQHRLFPGQRSLS